MVLNYKWLIIEKKIIRFLYTIVYIMNNYDILFERN